MYSREHRAFSYAVLASIALHGALLWGVSPRPRTPLAEVEFPPLFARLVEPPAPAPVAAPPTPPKAQPEKPRPEKPQTRPRPAPTPEPVAKAPPARAAEVPAPPSPPQEPVAESAQPAEPVPPVVARTEPSPPLEAQAPPPAARAFDPGTVAQYRLQLIGAARKYMRYPRLARENNWEGDVVVRMAFGGNGLLAGLSIQSSSGYSVLDQQALEMFRQAAKTVEVPSGLRGREFSFEVRAIYNLTDQGSG